MKGLEAIPGYTAIVVIQLILGGLAILFMDEVCQKWGFGSGISLFIAAGVGYRLFVASFGFLGTEGGICLLNFSSVSCPGRVLAFVQALTEGHSGSDLRFDHAGDGEFVPPDL